MTDSNVPEESAEQALADMRAGRPGPREAVARQIIATNPALADQLGLTETVEQQDLERWAKDSGRPMVSDLRVTLLPHGPERVALTYRWTGPLPEPRSSVLWSTTITSADGQTSRQLGYKRVDDQFSAQFVFDFTTSQQRNLTEDVERRGALLTVHFSADVIADLIGGTFTSAVNVDGVDVVTSSWP